MLDEKPYEAKAQSRTGFQFGSHILVQLLVGQAEHVGSEFVQSRETFMGKPVDNLSLKLITLFVIQGLQQCCDAFG